MPNFVTRDSVNPSYSYYSGHGDLAAEASHAGTRTRVVRLDPWGTPLTSPGSPDLQELFTGRWDKKHDQVSSLIEMGARPYAPLIGRFLAIDPVDGGALNEYDYAAQDPVNAYDLSGMCVMRSVPFIRHVTCPSPAQRQARTVLTAIAKEAAKNEYVGVCLVGGITGAVIASGSGPGAAVAAGGGCLHGIAVTWGKKQGGNLRAVALSAEYLGVAKTLTRAAVKGFLDQHVPSFTQVMLEQITLKKHSRMRAHAE